jgi:hypothetical protein
VKYKVGIALNEMSMRKILEPELLESSNSSAHLVILKAAEVYMYKLHY